MDPSKNEPVDRQRILFRSYDDTFLDLYSKERLFTCQDRNDFVCLDDRYVKDIWCDALAECLLDEDEYV